MIIENSKKKNYLIKDYFKEPINSKDYYFDLRDFIQFQYEKV